MPRYIDADALTEILKRLVKDDDNRRRCPSCWSDAFEIAIDLIKEIPTADVVKVVRCKDCNLRDTEMCPMMYWECGILLGYTEDIHFCSYGERKEQNDG